MKKPNRILRTSRVFLNALNKGKTERLISFLYLYANVVRYFIEMFWSVKDFNGKFSDKTITDRAVRRFGITARLAQLAGKQAKEIVKSQRKKSRRKQRMPRLKNITVTFDSRFFTLESFKGSFDWCLKFNSGVPNIVVPFNNTKHTLKFLNDPDWRLSNSVRLGLRKKGKTKRIFVDLIFERERPTLKQKGEVIGIDIGYRTLLATSEGQLIGEDFRQTVERLGKRRKTAHKYIRTEIDRYIKQLDLINVKAVYIERLKYVKHNKRGKFSRKVNRLLSFWMYSRVIQRLKQLCEVYGVLLLFKSPYKTSQRCPLCGNIDSRNRRADRFRCTSCGFENQADIVGAMNLKALGLAGAYSLRSLQTCSCGQG